MNENENDNIIMSRIAFERMQGTCTQSVIGKS